MPPRAGKAQTKATKSTTTTNNTVIEGDAGVSYGITITKSTGAFETVKIHAGITIPHGASKDTLKNLDALLVVAKEKVVNKLIADMDEITKAF